LLAPALPVGVAHPNHVTRDAFEHEVDALRALHSNAKATAYKWLEDCACCCCPGLGSGTPSTLHWLCREVDLAVALALAQDAAAPDFSAAQALAEHAAHHYRARLGELAVGGRAGDPKAVFARAAKEQTDLLLAGIGRAATEILLREAREARAALEQLERVLEAELHPRLKAVI
jgi:hypothetical protein